jgi:hypothetical protein
VKERVSGAINFDEEYEEMSLAKCGKLQLQLSWAAADFPLRAITPPEADKPQTFKSTHMNQLLPSQPPTSLRTPSFRPRSDVDVSQQLCVPVI